MKAYESTESQQNRRSIQILVSRLAQINSELESAFDANDRTAISKLWEEWDLVSEEICLLAEEPIVINLED